MKIGRNIKFDDRYYITFQFDGENTQRKWFFNTHRGAMRKFNQLLKEGADYLLIKEDTTI